MCIIVYYILLPFLVITGMELCILGQIVKRSPIWCSRCLNLVSYADPPTDRLCMFQLPNIKHRDLNLYCQAAWIAKRTLCFNNYFGAARYWKWPPNPLLLQKGMRTSLEWNGLKLDSILNENHDHSIFKTAIFGKMVDSSLLLHRLYLVCYSLKCESDRIKHLKRSYI